MRIPSPHPLARALPRRAAVVASACLASTCAWALPGDLDKSFHGGAFDIAVNVAATESSQSEAVAVQTDGKVLIGGFVRTGASLACCDWILLRRNADGTVDDTFAGGTGQVVLAVGGNASNGSTAGDLNAVVEQADGKILGVGIGLDATGTYRNVFVVRWNSNGTLDAGFGSAGKVETDFGPLGATDFMSVALQRDGKAVVVATQEDSSFPYKVEPVVLRYTTSGALDPTFGTGGIFRLAASVSSTLKGAAYAVTIQPNGMILVGTQQSNTTPEVLRLSASGALDTTFGSGGIATVTINDGIPLSPAGTMALDVLPNDDIVGLAREHGGWLFRLLPDGSLDTTFGPAATPGRAPVTTVTPWPWVVLPTGQMRVGNSEDNHTSTTFIKVAGFVPHGTIDSKFVQSPDVQGTTAVSSPSGKAVFPYAMDLQPDGRFVVVGLDYDRTFAARFQGNRLQLQPSAIAFAHANNVPTSSLQTSNAVTIAGLTGGVSVPIYVTGGSYILNGRVPTTRLGYAKNGDAIQLQHTSAATGATSVTTTLRVGGLNSASHPWIALGTQEVAKFISTTK